jgi:hypothetical protein
MPKTIAEYIALHEAELTYADRTDRVRDALYKALGGEAEDRWIWVRDITDTWVVYEDSGSGSPNPGCFRVDYTLDDAGDVTLGGTAVPVEATTTYTPAPKDPAPTPLIIEPDEAARELVGDTIPLIEAVVRRDGTVPICIIKPGWGTSGYYSADVLKETGPAAFPAETKMFWDHPSATEDADRPERSLRDLSAVLAGDAYWQEAGPAGAGLYGDAKVFADYQPALEELAPHIGVSIRAEGQAHLGEADGRNGLIIDSIVASKSVDFVTAAGAGGEVLQLFEAVRGHKPLQPKEAPVADSQELIEARRAQSEATQKLAEAEALGALAAAERDAQRTELARFRETALISEARDSVTFAIADTKYARVPDVTKARLVESIATNPPVNADGKLDGAALTTRFDEAMKSEIEYIAKLTGRGDGTVNGLGSDVTIDEAELTRTNADLENSFGRLGLSESGAKTAAAGRR